MNSPLDQPRPPVTRSSARRRTFAILAGAALLAILTLTLLPESAKHFLHTRGRFHSAGHVVAFAALAFVAGRSSRSRTALLLLFVGLICFGFATEFVEHLLDEQNIEWKDVLGDSGGVLAGSSIALFALGRRRRPARLRPSERWV